MPNKLEQTAITLRYALTNIDIYRQDWSLPADTSNNYTVTHTRALADDKTPVYGKGTGFFLATDDYTGGGEYDINGNPKIPGSGRNNAFAKNLSDWGFGPNKNYTIPDTSLNVGKFKIR